jgi:hypothetical protein
VVGGLLGCVCAPLIAPAQSAFAVSVSPGTISSVEGSQFSGQVATFSDLSLVVCQASSTYRSSVNWSDDNATSAASVGAPTQNGLTCTYPVSAGHRFTAVGAQHFTVAVTGTLGSDSATGRANITPAPLTSQPAQISAVEGGPFTAAVATFTDGFAGRPASHYTATVAWGDGSTTGATVVPTATGGFEVDAGHTYAAVGTYPTAVRVSEPEGSQTAAASTTTVADAPLSSSGVAGSAVEQVDFTHTVARFADADPGRPVGHYAATVNWGDGSGTAAATITTDPAGGYDVNASHSYATPGTYTTTVGIGDADGARSTATSQTSVADAPLGSAGIAIHAIAGQAFPAGLAVFTDADAGRPASHYSASVNWGDGSPATAATITADSSGSGYGVGSNHTYAKAGTYPIVVTITDSTGGSRTIASSTATVAAAPPPPAPAAAATPADAGTTTHAASTTKPAASPSPAPGPAAKPSATGVLPTPKVGLTSPRLSSSRTNISIDVTCPAGGASCQGVVRLTTLPSPRSKVAALRRGTIIGSVLFVLHPGQSKTFTIHVATKTLRLLRQAGLPQVRGIAVAFGQTGNATTSGPVAKLAVAVAVAVAGGKPKSK